MLYSWTAAWPDKHKLFRPLRWPSLNDLASCTRITRALASRPCWHSRASAEQILATDFVMPTDGGKGHRTEQTAEQCAALPMGNEAAAGREIFIVDDDPGVRKTLALMLEHKDYRVTSFADGASFLAAIREHVPACTVLDVRMPNQSGIEILRTLNAEDISGPIVVISGHGDIPMAVEAVKLGAFDFIEKPFHASTVVACVRQAIEAWARRGSAANRPAGMATDVPGYALLTPRELEVLDQIAAGASNKEAGRRLGISPRTIEVHRARTMEKLGAKNTADLVRIAIGARRGS